MRRGCVSQEHGEGGIGLTQRTGRLWTPDFCRLLAANFLLMSSGNLLTGMFSLFLVARGGADLHIGIAAYLFSGASLVVRPLSGWHLDHRSRSTLVIFGVAALILIPWGYVLAWQVPVIIAVRFLHGVVYSMAGTGVITSAYDALDRASFSRGVGYFGFSNAISTAVAPAVGLWLWDRFEALGVFGVVSLSMVAALLLLRRIHFHPVPPERQTRFRDERLGDLLFERDALPATVLEGFVALLSGAISPYLTLYLMQRGDIGNAGLFFTFQACGTFLSRIFVGRISDRWGETPLVFGSAGLFAASILLLVFGGSPALVFLAAVLLGIGYGLTVTGFQIMSVRIVPPERTGSAASTYSCGWDVFSGLGGLLGGVLASFMSYRALFASMLLVLPLFVLSYVCVFARHPSALRNVRRAQGR